MNGAKVLVVFYSRTGFTRALARQIAEALGGDIEDLADTRSRDGVLGYLRSGFEAALRRRTVLEPLAHEPASYDLVVVGTPVWNASLSSPVRTFLSDHGPEMKRVAFFCTFGGSGDARVFQQMIEASGRVPLTVMSLRNRDSGSPVQRTRVREFVGALQATAGAH